MTDRVETGRIPSRLPWSADDISIRGFTADDLETLVEYRNIEDVWRLQDWDVPYTMDRAMRFLDDDTSSFVPGEWVQLAVTHRGVFAGDIGFTAPGDDQPVWIGYSLHPDFWGRGIATSAVRLTMRRLHRFGATRFRASVDARNTASAALLVRCGFSLLDVKQPITVRGEDYLDDVYELAVDSGDFDLGAVGTEGS